MKKLAVNSRWALIICLVWWAWFLLLLVSPSIVGGSTILLPVLALLMVLGLPINVIALIVLFRGKGIQNAQDERYSSNLLAKTLGVLILMALATSVATAIKSAWIDPSYAKFAYENVAAGAGFGAIVLICILSALQKDIYWVPRKHTVDLDERQRHQRQQVFEVSYKLGAFLVLVAAFFFSSYARDIVVLSARNFNHFPGRLYWVAFDLALALFALPLVVAAWWKKKAH